MVNEPYKTLADVRNEDPAKFDATIKDAVHYAAEVLGPEMFIKAICGRGPDDVPYTADDE